MPEGPPDPTRRQFFRRFAGDVLASAVNVVGAVEGLRDAAADEAVSLLRDGQPAAPAPLPSVVPNRPWASAPAGQPATPGPDAGPRGFRTPFRMASEDVLLVIDQRRLPDELIEVPVRGAPDAAATIRDMVVRGAPAIGQVAAIGLALQARLARLALPYARRAIIQGAADSLIAARPTAVNLPWAVGRLMDRYAAVGTLDPDGAAIAAAMWDEAMAIVAEATEDHGRLAEAGLALLPAFEDRPTEILTHCNTGPLACGQYGTALGVVQAAHHAERRVHVWVDETRPYLQGARLTAWELEQAGVPHTLIPDMAAGPVLRRGPVDAVLVGADRVAANGDTANKLGTYTLAVLAARHGVPFYVCAPLSSVDPATPDGAGIPIEERPASEVTTVRGQRITHPDAIVHNPSFDVTPADLITGIVTDEGVLRPPFGPALAAALGRRAARRAAAGRGPSPAADAGPG
jgi:methylthioribose-1-phosphate isomerase